MGHCKIKTMNNIRIKTTGEKSIIIGKERNAPKNKYMARTKTATSYPTMHGKQSLATRGGARRHISRNNKVDSCPLKSSMVAIYNKKEK